MKVQNSSHETVMPKSFSMVARTDLTVLLSDMVPVGAEEIVGAYNEFRSSIVLLQELKHTLQTAEYELESLRTRYSVLAGKVCLVHFLPNEICNIICMLFLM